MAQTLTKNDSTPKVRRAVRRHVRLTRRLGNAEATRLAERIAEPDERLKAAADAALTLQNAAADAFDDWTQDDEALDAAVRSVHRKCEGYDADHPGANTTQLVFNGQPPSQVTKAPRGKEPSLVAALVARGANLPADHPVASALSGLMELAERSRSSERAWIDATQRTVQAAAEVDVARLQVVRTYRDNAIDIARAIGDELTRRCFPILRKTSSGRGAGDEEPEIGDADT